jgi:hypothetical protein
VSALYGRTWSLTLVPPGKTQGAAYGTQAGNSNLRMTFDLERTLSSTSNKGKFGLYNLNPENRANIVQGTNVFLRAGYGDELGTIFQGFVRKVENSLQGPDVVTSIECGDGDPYITYGHLNFSWSETVSLAQILEYICSKLSVTIGGQVYAAKGKIIQGLPDATFPRYKLHGKVKTELEKLLHPFGLLWSVQCGVLLIQNSKGLVHLTATYLSKDTGLLDVPTRTDTGVRCRSLLNPRIVPGSAIAIASYDLAASGNFRCIKCTYKGDSEGTDWSVEVEGQALLGPLAPVPTAQGKQKVQQSVYDDPDDPEDAEEAE